MATHSSILAWKIPWTEEPCRLQSMVWQRVGHDRATSLSLSFFEQFIVEHQGNSFYSVWFNTQKCSLENILSQIMRMKVILCQWVSFRCSTIFAYVFQLISRGWSFFKRALFGWPSYKCFFFFIVVIVWIFSLFKKFYLFFNWRIIPSQNFVVFCQTSLTSFQLSGLFQGSLFKQIPGWPCFLCGDRKGLSEQLSQAEAWKITRSWPS